ncbi:MAG: lysophospholipid acyltransferase family protein [Candidatus Nanopelagicales bacterium]
MSAAHLTPAPDEQPDAVRPGQGLDTPTRPYEVLLAEARDRYPGVRIGRPGRSRAYWPTIAVMRLLRARWAVRLEGAEQVAPGPAILIANHVHFLDPLCVVMTQWWRVSAFTKLEWFEHSSALFFRAMGQIPLRRGDPDATEWAMQMSRYALADGGRIGLYPEGTRTPDTNVLHKLHKRIMIPLLQANPDVPVHVVATSYEEHPFPRRTQVAVHVSPRLALDARTMTADGLTDRIRDALLALGGQRYEDRYAQDVKAELRGTQEQAGPRPVTRPDGPGR